MFKDYKKYLEISLKVYLFVLIITFILKIVGLDYFGIDVNNPVIIRVDELFTKYHLVSIWYSITLYINIYFIMAISSNDNSSKMKLKSLIILILFIIIQLLTAKYNLTNYKFLLEIIVFLIALKFKNIKRFIFVYLFNSVYQIISLLTRIGYVSLKIDSFVYQFIMQLDFVLLLIISYRVYFSKGGTKLCGVEVYLSSLKKTNLKKLLQKLQKNFQNSLEAFKKQSRQEKLTIIIFTILSLIWNTLTVLIVLLIAKINDTFVECIFILTSFWLSKRSFGKAFHFDSMIICFIVSNLTYYVLNRITAPLGISMLVPILLGVGLSYVTSKFVKKTYKPLYRGMSKDLFDETILQVVDKYSDKYKICYEFYIDKKSDLSLSYKYNYSVSGIRKIKERINEKIKRL
jgi:hypothetical protein